MHSYTYLLECSSGFIDWGGLRKIPRFQPRWAGVVFVVVLYFDDEIFLGSNCEWINQNLICEIIFFGTDTTLSTIIHLSWVLCWSDRLFLIEAEANCRVKYVACILFCFVLFCFVLYLCENKETSEFLFSPFICCWWWYCCCRSSTVVELLARNCYFHPFESVSHGL